MMIRRTRGVMEEKVENEPTNAAVRFGIGFIS
jgi:hypothetical protein